VQKEILDANPGANVRVYAVWFNMLPRDSRSGFPSDLLTDHRVTQFWDEHHLVGTAFAPLADWHKGVLWDAYFLYPRAARWESGAASAPPKVQSEASGESAPRELPRPTSWGRTIFSTRDQLKREFDALVAK
jgi:hypothetical protein